MSPLTSSPQMCNMLGLGDMNADQLASKLEETLPVIRSVSEQFKDPVSCGPGGRREARGKETGLKSAPPCPLLDPAGANHLHLCVHC